MKNILVIFALLLFISPFVAQGSVVKNNKEQVVILHGIARSKSHMESLATYLKENGEYEVFNINYPSTKYNLQELTKIVHDDLASKIDSKKIVNFVGYSMGGLVVRSLINKYKYPNLGKVVLLASPNHGSEVADFIKNFWPYKKIYGPAGQQLTTNRPDIETLLGQVSYDLGIIAGNSTIDPFSSMIIPGDDDGKVSIISTKVKGMKDHIIVNASHTFFPSNKKVKEHTLNFLQYSKFNHK